MRLNITVLPGDGVGPEVTREAVNVLCAAGELYGFTLQFREQAIGATAIRQFGSPLPPATLDACLASDAVLLGAVGDSAFDGLPTEQRPEAGLLGLRWVGGVSDRHARSDRFAGRGLFLFGRRY